MAVDPQGRLIVSPQIAGLPSTNPVPPTLFRLTIDNGKVSHVEKIQKGISEPQGMLYAFDSLYVNGNGPEGLGIYRLRRRGSDDFEDPQLLRPVPYAGEHGSHSLVLGPDKKIYIASGNYIDHAQLEPNKISSASPFQHFGEDQLLPSFADAQGIPEGSATSPRGTIARMNASGGEFEIFCGETRNIYDIAFKEDGELFGFDNDHETDWGTPWYRPCLLYHLVSGADYGYREGSGKLPDYLEDILPAVKKLSIGAPTGMKFATGTKFPKNYRTALFMCEWNFGRIFAAHLHPNGSGYICDVETVVHGTPLNVTDIEVTPDGSMYFITGGHNTRSTLYRLDYTNQVETISPAESQASKSEVANLRSIRHELETFHGNRDSSAINAAWPFLSHSDREIRYAARVAVESQPVRKWKERALNETNPVAALPALVALARVGGKDVQPTLLQSISKFPFASLSTNEALLKLRALELSFIRQGRQTADIASRVAADLSP
ncbi:MAG: heme-binding protein, partial [Verrucomicrobiales bacterium]|nr:heme-binding protein [Verrucomicrobiales bacterium]